LPILKNNTVKKKWAYAGGALVLASAGVWGLYNLETTGDIPLPPPSNISANVSSLPEDLAPPEDNTLWTVKTHTVKDGDTLSAIAAQYAIDVDTILSANPNIDETIHPGDELKILPEKGVFYVVKAGDNLWRIGQNHNLTVEAIVKANQKANDQIEVGESIFIPGARFARTRTESRTQSVVSRAGGSRFSWPAGGELSSFFGSRWGGTHTGIDIANETGAPVTASSSGQVIWVGQKGGYGTTVMINHGNGYVTLYGHLDNYFVTRGQYVRQGQRIATLGNTGQSTGPHLHFEILHNGDPLDPMRILP
jgi:murein DD-endopeptidase MepM/ murein hydrolase activator NlpD